MERVVELTIRLKIELEAVVKPADEPVVPSTPDPRELSASEEQVVRNAILHVLIRADGGKLSITDLRKAVLRDRGINMFELPSNILTRMLNDGLVEIQPAGILTAAIIGVTAAGSRLV